MNPVVAIAHVLGIAAGVWGGLWLIDRVAPDLPGPDVEAGVTATVPEEVEGADEGSLYRPGPLSTALIQLDEQLGEQQLVTLQVEPAELTTQARDPQDGLIDAGDVPASAPSWIIAQIAEKRPEVTLDSLRWVALIATDERPFWQAQLVSHDPRIPQPWTYTADLEGDLLEGDRLPRLPLLPLAGD